MPSDRSCGMTSAAGRSADPRHLAFLRDRRVGHLATADAAGTPSVVPVVYAVIELDGEPVIVTAIDEKPKGEPRALRRVRDIAARPDVALVVDDYHEDWAALVWAIARGRASLREPGEPGHAEAVAALRAKYPQYARHRLETRPVIVIADLVTRGWRGSGEGSVDAAARPGQDALAALAQGRRSVRAFETRPVPREIVEAAIAAAGWAPSPHGRQPWRFVVIESQARREALADAMAETWREQLRLDGQDEATVEARLEKSRDRLRRAPVLVLTCLYLAGLDVYPDPARQAAEATMAVQSLGAAVQNLLLALYAAGVDGGWMCAPLFCPDVVRATLGLGPGLDPHALIAVGYAAADPLRRPRLPLDALIVDWQ